MDNQVKITYNKLGYAPLVGWIVRFYLIFKEFLEKMQKKKNNWDKDWIWQVRMYST